uniref:flagellin n=1 Tax=Photobacterium ganghwense TaxID=320778 RepID=UPI00359FE801
MRSTALGNSSVDLAGAAISSFNTTGTNAVTAQTLTVTGTDGQKDVAVAAAASAEDIAAAVNKATSDTGVKAEAFTGVRLSNMTLDAAGDNTLDVNGKTYSMPSGSEEASLVDKINADSKETGLRAIANDDGTVDIVSESGKNIDITAGGTTTGFSMNLTELNADMSTTGGATATVDNTNATQSLTGQVNLKTNNPQSNTLSVTTSEGTAAGQITTGAETVSLNSVDSIDISSANGAQSAVSTIDSAIAQIDTQRADLGAFQNRMNHTLNNLANINENVSASNSRIKDVDFAKETTNLTKNQILQQASTSILAQAKQNPQAALSLL